MDLDPEVAHTYAEGLIGAAHRGGAVDAIFEQTLSVQAFFHRGARLRVFLENPGIRKDRKHEMIERVFGGRIEPLLVRLMHVMLERNRVVNLEDALGVAHDLVEEQRGIVKATAVTAVPMSDEQKARLEQTLESRLGLQFRIHYAVDPDVLGGVVFKYGDRLIDGSLAWDLQRLRERLMGITSAAFESPAESPE